MKKSPIDPRTLADRIYCQDCGLFIGLIGKRGSRPVMDTCRSPSKPYGYVCVMMRELDGPEAAAREQSSTRAREPSELGVARKVRNARADGLGW